MDADPDLFLFELGFKIPLSQVNGAKESGDESLDRDVDTLDIPILISDIRVVFRNDFVGGEMGEFSRDLKGLFPQPSLSTRRILSAARDSDVALTLLVPSRISTGGSFVKISMMIGAQFGNPKWPDSHGQLSGNNIAP